MGYNNFDIENILESMTLLVDTREQPTKRLADRLEIINLPYETTKLNVGDYSCKASLPNGEILDMSSIAVIERKMNIDELCMCFGRERDRFRREFERAKDTGTRMYLLVEDADWEKILNGKYRSQYNSKALTASILAYQLRYDARVVFCRAETTGRIIREILYRELKHYLEEVLIYDDVGSGT